MSLLQELNHRYIELHEAKENAFWGQKMGLASYAAGEFEKHEIALKEFSSDARNLERVRTERLRDDLGADERVALAGWQRYFEVNVLEGEEAKRAYNELIALEGELERARGAMPLGYTDPKSGELKRASSVALSLMMSTSDDEALRRAAFDGLRSIEPFVLDNGFIEVVKQRNRLARLLGYEDYYDYKVTINEGFGKQVLFSILDDLELNTRDACRRSIEGMVAEYGDASIEPWNSSYYQTGDVTTLTDPYFRFEDSLETWGRMFAALGIRYRRATLQLDLVERAGKHDNGFMHGPGPAWIEEGRWHPARINFTANAVPGQIGSGRRALNTLLHEGGHAAHFSNIRMPAPCFAQEFAPTSVAFAETQSMFLDSVMEDADWLTRYARNEAGEPMPVELIDLLKEKEHRYRAAMLRRMLTVCYFEKAIYEMSPDMLTPENIIATARRVESWLLFQSGSARPVLSIPHILAGEASAYYHGYVLAELAVDQTREYFINKYGHIVDQPAIGPELAEKYWSPGNSKTFLQFIEDLTGEPFSARATVALVNRGPEELKAETRESIERLTNIPEYTGPIDLDANIAIVHGDAVVAAGPFDALSESFRNWIVSETEKRSAEVKG